MTPNKLCELPLCSYIIIRLFVQFKLRIGEIQKIALYKFIITVLIVLIWSATESYAGAWLPEVGTYSNLG